LQAIDEAAKEYQKNKSGVGRYQPPVNKKYGVIKMRYAIIGSGPAGVTAAETLKAKHPDAEVKLIGDEPEPPYSRMAIPYLLVGKVDESGTYLRRSGDHYQQRGIDVVQDRVDRVDASGKALQLKSGATVAYDRLLIASGSHPNRPPIPGIDLPQVQSCWTLADAREIINRASEGSRVVLMGAGFIGCIVMEALALRGVKLTVVEMGDRMVPRMMNQTAGGMIKRWCESKGVAVHTSAQVTAIEAQRVGLLKKVLGGASEGVQVKLASGVSIDADLVISATGVKPNVGFLEGTGIEMDQGILVDRNMQSSFPNIYAAGDVAQGRDFSTGEQSVQAIQPTAVEHGRIAALNMAGDTVDHQGSVSMNVLDTLGLISSSFGLWMGAEGGTQAELLDKAGFRYINLQFQEDRLVGATSIGLTQHVGVLRGLIQSQTRLGVWADRLQKDPTRIMEAYLGSTQVIKA
jgi:NAD(P)H-nitrite reductase large subunit